MKAFLLFLSSLIILLCPLTASARNNDSARTVAKLPAYTFRIENPKGCVSGILLATESDREIKGSMVNEFGVSAINFIYNKEKRKIKLVNVIDFLNKWYIRMVLKKDLKLCMDILYGTPDKVGKHHEIIRDGDNVSVINNKHKLTYLFTVLDTSALDSEPSELTNETEE